MKRWRLILIIGLIMLISAASPNINMDYELALAIGGIGAVLTIVGVILWRKDRRITAEATRQAAEQARVKQLFEESAQRELAMQAAAAQAEEQAAAAKRAEWEKTHGRFVTNIAGVTFDNDDGSSRQKNLRDLETRGGEGEVSLEEYYYKGHKAVRVLIDGKCIGNIPKDRVQEALDLMDKEITAARLNIETFTPNDEDDDRPKKIYRADLTMVYKK